MSKKPARKLSDDSQSTKQRMRAPAQRAHTADVKKVKPEGASHSCHLASGRLRGWGALFKGSFLGAFKCTGFLVLTLFCAATWSICQTSLLVRGIAQAIRDPPVSALSHYRSKVDCCFCEFGIAFESRRCQSTEAWQACPEACTIPRTNSVFLIQQPG